MDTYREARRVTAACLALMIVLGMAMALALLAEAVWPEASGDKMYEKGSLTVDASHAGDGYIMARAKPGKKKLKLRVTKDDTTYTYDLNLEGEYEVFPLQMGSGKYVLSLYQNAQGKKYSKVAEVSLKAELEDENAPYVCPSQYVNYTKDSPAVLAAQELCQGLTTDKEKVDAIVGFMTRNFAYDYVRSLTISTAYLGDVDGCFTSRMGLCQDLAAVAACMLRSQGVPTQLVIGYAGKTYHAWNNVLIDGAYQRIDVTGALSGLTGNTVYTAERYY